MKKFVTAALAAAVAGSVTYAEPNDNEWLELDSEINSLATNLRPSRDGTGWSFLFRANYTASFDDVGTGGGNNPDIAGFEYDDLDAAFWGASGQYGWRLSFDVGALDGLIVEDAYVFWDCGDFTTTLGNFKPQVVRSGYVDPENQLMINRTVLGSAFDAWDTGIGASGSWEDLTWSVSVMNGSDSQASPSAYAGRVEYNLGEAASSRNTAAIREGSRGGGEGLNATAGLAFYSSDSGGAGTQGREMHGIFADFNGNFGPIGFGAEVGIIQDINAQIAGTGVSSDFSNVMIPVFLTQDSVPFSLTGSYNVNDKIEVGARIEVLDNDDAANGGLDQTLFSVVAAFHQADNAKWQAQWTQISGDDMGAVDGDGSVFQVGVTVGASR